jgi:hypothetical protein
LKSCSCFSKFHFVKRCSISLSLFLICLCLSAQPRAGGDAPALLSDKGPVKQNSLLVSAGYDQYKDENLHSKVFRGLGIGVLFQHSKTNINILEWDAGFRFTALNNVFEEFPSAAAIHFLGRYTYLFKVAYNNKMQYYIGPMGDFKYGTSAYFNWDESHLYYANYMAGGFSGRVSYMISSKTIDFNLDFPIVSVISRPELNRQYKIDNMRPGGIFSNLASNPKFALLKRNFFIRMGVELKYLSKQFKPRAVAFRYSYHYMRASSGNAFQNMEYSFSYKFFL